MSACPESLRRTWLNKVDLIVTSGRPTALAAKNTTTTIPIVMASAADPAGSGLVASLARPGGNVTGFSDLAVELNTKRLEGILSVRGSQARASWTSGGGGGLLRPP